jgi:hypothetical protein
MLDRYVDISIGKVINLRCVAAFDNILESAFGKFRSKKVT